MSNEQKSPNMIMEAKEHFPELAHYFDEKDVRGCDRRARFGHRTQSLP